MSEVEEKKPTWKEKYKARRARRAERTLRLRWLKNLIWWLTGLISGLAVLVCGVFVGVKVVPLKTLLGEDNTYVSEDIANKSLIDAVMGFSQYKLSDIPVVSDTLKSLITDLGLDQYVTVDYDKLNNVKFSYEDGETDFASELQACLSVTATIDSIGGAEMLGDFGNLSVIKDFDKVTEEIDATAEGFNAKLYYYKTGDTYARAYDDDGNRIAESEGQDLYYPALASVPIVDMVDIFSDRFSGIKITSMIECFSGTLEEDSIINKIFAGKTLSDMNSFKPDDILLKDVLGSSEDSNTLYDILCQAVKVGDGETKPDKDSINLGHLLSIDINNVSLTTVIPNASGTADLYNILCDATGIGSAENIKIGDLSNLDIDAIYLNKVLQTTGNEKLYNVLCEALSTPENTVEAEDIRITDLTDFNIDKVSLVTVLPNDSGTADLYNILRDATGIGSADDIKIGNLSSLDINNIKLTSVLPKDGNDDIYKILCEALSTTESTVTADDIKIGDLTSFNIDNVSLTTVLTKTPENAMLYNVLCEATGKNEEDIKIFNLSSFSITNVKLATVLDGSTVSGNKILEKLVSDESVTIGNLGEKLNDLSLSDVYDVTVFEPYTEGSGKARYIYDGVNTYTLDDSGTYQISSGATVWLFLLYDYGTTESGSIDIDENGNAKTYTSKNLTVAGIDTAVEGVSDKFMGATIKQCVDCGIVSGSYDKINNLTLKAVLESLNSMLPD